MVTNIDVVTKNVDLVMVRVEVPGGKQEDADSTLQAGVLSHSGERKAEWKEERGGYYVRKRRYGSFSRSLTQGTDESKVRAHYENAVLEVTRRIGPGESLRIK